MSILTLDGVQEDVVDILLNSKAWYSNCMNVTMLL